MATVDTCQLVEQVEAIQQLGAQALKTESADDFDRFEKRLNTLRTAVRETQQAMWASEAEAAILRLESGEPLTDADCEVIRTFLISDAEHYLAVENNYQDWTNELKRLTNDISRRALNLDRAAIGELSGVLKDMVRLVPDIRNYLEEQQRVEKFNVAMHTFDDAARATLARVMREQLDRRNR